MEQPTQFRSAFNGFNREDVVRYMEFINNKHSAQVAQLNNELEYLRSKQTSADADRQAELEQQLQDAEAENETLKQRISELEQQLQQSAQKPAAPVIQPMQELEAYRRAERTERMARERARQISRQTTEVLKNSSEKVDEVSAQIALITGQLAEQLNLLQSAMDGSHQSFRDAYTMMAKLDSEFE